MCALLASSSVGEQLTIALSLISMVFSVYPKKKENKVNYLIRISFMDCLLSGSEAFPVELSTHQI